ncbi:MAG: XTP/dITP diphosphatase [bacterium]|nr:XTP/dITP diphosphatase [bacterium]
MKEIVLASTNQGKLKELRKLLSDIEIKVLSLNDFPEAPEVIEDGITFEENALKKAMQIAKYTKKLAIADDSGLEVLALGGAPGVESSRFAKNDKERVDKLLKVMENKRNREAKFICAIAIANPGNEVKVVRGEVEGVITEAPKGNCGFGYDPVFVAEGYTKTFAEISMEEKNKISHRAKALIKAKKVLEEKLLEV